jgi:hypothetical protein
MYMYMYTCMHVPVCAGVCTGMHTGAGAGAADGTTQEAACFIPGEAAEAPKIDCPPPFVNPISDTNVESCIQPCPVQAHADNECTLTWGVSNGIGLVGFCLNVFMASTWTLGGKAHVFGQPFQLKACVFVGILYGMVATLPSLVNIICEAAHAHTLIIICYTGVLYMQTHH